MAERSLSDSECCVATEGTAFSLLYNLLAFFSQLYCYYLRAGIFSDEDPTN